MDICYAELISWGSLLLSLLGMRNMSIVDISFSRSDILGLSVGRSHLQHGAHFRFDLIHCRFIIVYY